VLKQREGSWRRAVRGGSTAFPTRKTTGSPPKVPDLATRRGKNPIFGLTGGRARPSPRTKKGKGALPLTRRLDPITGPEESGRDLCWKKKKQHHLAAEKKRKVLVLDPRKTARAPSPAQRRGH